jgi:hypothetical protein
MENLSLKCVHHIIYVVRIQSIECVILLAIERPKILRELGTVDLRLPYP